MLQTLWKYRPENKIKAFVVLRIKSDSYKIFINLTLLGLLQGCDSFFGYYYRVLPNSNPYSVQNCRGFSKFRRFSKFAPFRNAPGFLYCRGIFEIRRKSHRFIPKIRGCELFGYYYRVLQIRVQDRIAGVFEIAGFRNSAPFRNAKIGFYKIRSALNFPASSALTNSWIRPAAIGLRLGC